MSIILTVPFRQPEDVIVHLGKGDKHWKPRRSAYELAHAWGQDRSVPPAVKLVLDRCADYRNAIPIVGIFEHKTSLPGRGYPSQTDLLLFVRLGDGPQGVPKHALIAVEGKAGESFGPTVAKWRAKDPSPGKEERLARLCELLGLASSATDELRYQLIHRTASAILEAHRFGCADAMMLVHRFGDSSSEASEDFKDFVKFAESLAARVTTLGVVSEAAKRVASLRLRLAWVDSACREPQLA